MRFALYKGQGQYGSLRLHIDQLAQALTGLGHDVRILDLMAPDANEPIRAAIADPPDAFFGISGVGSDIRLGDRSAYDHLGKPYASLYVDHPTYHLQRLSNPIAKHLVFFLDRTHVQFMTAWARRGAFAHLGFLPPGANELPDPVDLSDEAYARRDIGVLFTGTYRGAAPTPWTEWPQGPAPTIMAGVAERMAADARLPLMDALKSALHALGGELTAEYLQSLAPILHAGQAFAEAYHRDRLLQTLGKAGVPIDVRGHGWEPLAERYPSFRYGGVGSFEETLGLLRRTKVVLNINNGFLAGGHERVFTAMCAGAAVFSDSTKYYADAFKEGRELETFAWPKMDEAPAKLAALAADEPRAAGIARAGAKKATAEHRWTDRAAKLVKAIRQA
ncbi:glycosyltransferase [Phenylobacterium sp. J367]|uniref:glycosyltransferase family protein n=1 Tax=Phenylobacterium sp. J367 TaxID=2898435 RepID=UPI0021513F3F|nr:glycosyltransferase [Phenylobacterium sp. J367]MCR5879727.1 glycosyltransferase [Phenylobacterium sp. J367]